MPHRRPPAVASGLLAIPRERDHLVPLVHDLHTLGLPPGSITVFGAEEPALVAALAAEGDPMPRPGAPAALAELLEPTARFEAFGATVGAVAGLLGGLVALALPGSGVLWFAGGVSLILLEETAAALTGLGLGGVIGAWLGWEVALRHADLFEDALARGRWIVLVRGAPEQIRLARARLEGYAPEHLDQL
jgi:hypothetical protein